MLLADTICCIFVGAPPIWCVCYSGSPCHFVAGDARRLLHVLFYASDRLVHFTVTLLSLSLPLMHVIPLWQWRSQSIVFPIKSGKALWWFEPRTHPYLYAKLWRYLPSWCCVCIAAPPAALFLVSDCWWYQTSTSRAVLRFWSSCPFHCNFVIVATLLPGT